MLKSFAARNFRCLADFELHNLARMNLLVGDNDEGKTALLEALFAHLSQANPTSFLILKAFRRSVGSVDDTFWQEFFANLDDSRDIHLSSVDSAGRERKNKFTVGERVQITVSAPPASGSNIRIPAGSPLGSVSFRPLRVEYQDGTREEPLRNEIVFNPSILTFVPEHRIEPDLPAYFFSAAGPPEADTVAKQLSQLVVNKQEIALTNLAKVMDDRIQGLFVASPRGAIEAFVDLGERRLFPLTLMGSGVVRAIGIAAAVLVYAAGLILVDEIEDGIYYKRLGDFWKMLYEMAKRSDAQIIASTHSAECVGAAMEAITPDLKDADPLHIYRLVRGRRLPIPYEKESLKSADEFMAELR
jgi:hypothetical protein